MMTAIDNVLNKIPMYRLVVYETLLLLGVAGICGYFGYLQINPLFLAFSTALIFFVCVGVNFIFATLFDAPSNPESTWITALILALIISPPQSFFDPRYLPLALSASVLAVASKYILAVQKKHLFNPAAAGVAITAATLGLSATWWIGTPLMLPFVLLGGLLVVRKIHRFDLWWAFILTFFFGTIAATATGGGDIMLALSQSFVYAPAFFFATVMLTEPMTTPPTRLYRILYGALVGFLFLPEIHLGSFYLTPEISLIVGNMFSYLVSPDYKLFLTLKEKIRLSQDVYEFVFTPDRSVSFAPGQYMEWTLPHRNADSRGLRRYFTIASSPTESDLRLGVKFYSPSSTFKRALYAMQPGETIIASQLSGDFTLPRNAKKKLVFLAGGIGITPFRSQLQYLLDTEQKRPITILYSNKMPQDAVYRALLDRAQKEIGAKVVYAFTGTSAALPAGGVPSINEDVVAREVPDYKGSTFYISGPQGMVGAYKKMLLGMGVPNRHIRCDYFPGFA